MKNLPKQNDEHASMAALSSPDLRTLRTSLDLSEGLKALAKCPDGYFFDVCLFVWFFFFFSENAGPCRSRSEHVCVAAAWITICNDEHKKVKTVSVSI